MQNRDKLRRIVFIGVMSAIIWPFTSIRIGPYIHFGNIMCALGGLLFGPMAGGVASGLGSMLYDLVSGNPGGLLGPFGAPVTFITKFAIGWVAGRIAWQKPHWGGSHTRNVVAAFCGNFGYIMLYMVRKLVEQRFIAGLPWEGVFAAMGTSLVSSLINMGLTIVIAPALAAAVRPALVRARALRDPYATK
jgi:uncharacterized membrane protein